MKFQKKPVVIEAMQLTESNRAEILQWAKSYAPLGTLIGAVPKSGHPHQMLVHTLEGTMTANVGDYIIRGVQGEFYPCKPDIFEQTYDEAEEKDVASTDTLEFDMTATAENGVAIPMRAVFEYPMGYGFYAVKALEMLPEQSGSMYQQMLDRSDMSTVQMLLKLQGEAQSDDE